MNSTMSIRFGAFNPRRNLPAASGRKRGEANFVAAFERDFAEHQKGHGVGGRQFELSGYGIADFVWIEFGRKQGHNPQGDAVLTAFEMKLKDWKRAVAQAYRYSYFADRTIVVLPDEIANRAEKHLATFERLGIGLWSYDPGVEGIEKRFTPALGKARNPAARTKAIARISRKIKLAQPGK